MKRRILYHVRSCRVHFVFDVVQVKTQPRTQYWHILHPKNICIFSRPRVFGITSAGVNENSLFIRYNIIHSIFDKCVRVYFLRAGISIVQTILIFFLVLFRYLLRLSQRVQNARTGRIPERQPIASTTFSQDNFGFRLIRYM